MNALCEVLVITGSPAPGTAADDASIVFATLFDAYRDRFFAAFRQEQFAARDHPPDEPERNAVLGVAEMRVSEARATELRRRQRQVIDDDLREPAAEEAGGVPFNAPIAFYTAEEPDAR